VHRQSRERRDTVLPVCQSGKKYACAVISFAGANCGGPEITRKRLRLRYIVILSRSRNEFQRISGGIRGDMDFCAEN